MSPLQFAPEALPVVAASLTGTHLGRTVTTPPSVSKLPPVTGVLTAIRQYRSASNRPLTTLEVTANARTTSRTVLGDVIVTLTRTP